MPALATIFSPAKVNLFLAVTGRRPDGFHNLVSLVAPLEWGDTLELEAAPGPGDELACAMPGVPTDGTNLVLRAAAAWREAGGVAPPVRFVLHKRIPPGAGLGGGSSNAVAALRGLQRMARRPVADDLLPGVAAAIGSDCPLFLAGGPVVIRGRGERVEPVSAALAATLAGRRLLVVKPGFGIDTAWAYGRLAAGAPGSYADPGEAEARLAAWAAGGPVPTGNSFAAVAFGKFIALPVLAEKLRRETGLDLQLSGSGSACFAWLPGDEQLLSRAVELVRDAWGTAALCEATRVAVAVYADPS